MPAVLALRRLPSELRGHPDIEPVWMPYGAGAKDSCR